MKYFDLDPALQCNDEDYDVVEVKDIPKSCHSSYGTDVDKSVYDVPRPKISRMMRKSQSSFNLNLRSHDTENGFKRNNPQPPIPSPRKLYPSVSHDSPPPLPEKTPADISKRLFTDDQYRTENAVQPKLSPHFSSKTMKPKKKTNLNDSERFRPRNNSESNKQPQEVYNELAAILERRRRNLENTTDGEKKPSSDFSDDIPPYSKVNKVSKQNNILDSSGLKKQNQANPSFLHTFVKST